MISTILGIAGATLFGIVLLVFGVLGIGLYILSLMLFRRVVPINSVHVVQGRKQTRVYGKDKGSTTYVSWPGWVPGLGVAVLRLPTNVFQIDLKDYEAYDQKRVPFKLDAVAFFRIEDFDMAARRCADFADLQKQLQNIVMGAVRKVLATNPLENILEDRAGLSGSFTEEVKQNIEQWGVTTVKTIEFMDIRDSAGSQVIADLMQQEQSRVSSQSRIAVAANKQAAEVAEVDAKRQTDLAKQEAEEQVAIRRNDSKQAVQLAENVTAREIASARAETRRLELDVEQLESVRNAEIERDVARVQAEKRAATDQVQAEANARQDVIRADAARQVREREAEAEAAATRARAIGEAEATQARANAEADAVRARAEAEFVRESRAAEALRLTGEAKAATQAALEMAPVNAQIAIAKEIGSNEGYQRHLQGLRQIEASQAVGIAQAEALGKADLKVIATGNETAAVPEGLAGLLRMVTPKGAAGLATALDTFVSSPVGKALVERVADGKVAPEPDRVSVVNNTSNPTPEAGAAAIAAIAKTGKEKPSERLAKLRKHPYDGNIDEQE